MIQFIQLKLAWLKLAQQNILTLADSSRNLIAAMDDDFEFVDKTNVIKDAGAKGFNPGLIVLIIVGVLLVTFIAGNYALYMYAQKTLPPKKKKPVSKKKMKKERLKQGVSAPGE